MLDDGVCSGGSRAWGWDLLAVVARACGKCSCQLLSAYAMSSYVVK